MKNIISVLPLLFYTLVLGQNIHAVQLFNPKTNDQTPIISLGENLVLRFDDLDNNSTQYRYTIKHYDRNWNDDGLFYTEYAQGPLNAPIENFSYSFNTLQKYTHYELTFPNEKIQLKISGNYEIIIYKDSPQKPIISKKFSVYENLLSLNLRQTRILGNNQPQKNQRVEIIGTAENTTLLSHVNTFGLTIFQNNNLQTAIQDLQPSSTLGNQVLFQQMQISFPGNNQFYYFDNKNMNMTFDMVAGGEIINQENHTYLHPTMAYPANYQYQPDVNGAFYFRRNDLGIERNANKEGDYSWIYFFLDSEPFHKNIYVLGAFNEYQAKKEYQMIYDYQRKQYVAKIYLKQGFYNYTFATQEEDSSLNLGEINGNFWQTTNLYQALLYYRPFGRNYDGIAGYGELRKINP